MASLQSRYAASRARLIERATGAAVAAGVDTTREVSVQAERFGVSRKKRAASEYTDFATYLLTHYPPELAYFMAVELDKQFEPRLGYPPIGQIMVAMEKQESEDAARWIACALRNFPHVETAKLAFGVVKSPGMRLLVRADLVLEDMELAEYICSGEVADERQNSALPANDPAPRMKVGHPQELSDGIELMPRRLTDGERSGDRLFLHLQVLSSVFLLMCPALGGVLRGWLGGGIGLIVGWMVRTWMRRSMGLRGSNPNDGFFIRMRERANGARRGILEAMIENVRHRQFNREQCIAITRAWDETGQRLAGITSQEEKRALINALDAKVKRISYGQYD